MNRTILRTIIALAAFVAITTIYGNVDASAALFGREHQKGYFGNQTVNFVSNDPNHVIDSGLPGDVEGFITKIQGLANGSSSRDNTGAAFLICHMMGKKAGECNREDAKNLATEWGEMIRAFNEAGWFHPDFGANEDFSASDWAYSDGSDVAWYEMGGWKDNPGQSNHYAGKNAGPYIVIENGSEQVYFIRKECGNTGHIAVGDLPNHAPTIINGHTKL
jgi:hypothetical protein